jgi:hypothetical protein
LLLENTLKAIGLLGAGGIRFMAAGAILIVNAAASRLLRIESEFRVAFAAFDIASRQREQNRHHSAEPQEQDRGRPEIARTPVIHLILKQSSQPHS